MDDTLIYRKIELEELNLDLFRKFERRQNVARQLQKQGDAWVEKPVSLVEEWSREDYEFLLTCLQNTIQEGGVVFGSLSLFRITLPRSPESPSATPEPTGISQAFMSQESFGAGESALASSIWPPAGLWPWADRNSTSPPIRPSKASSFTGLWAAPTPWSSTRSM